MRSPTHVLHRPPIGWCRVAFFLARLAQRGNPEASQAANLHAASCAFRLAAGGVGRWERVKGLECATCLTFFVASGRPRHRWRPETANGRYQRSFPCCRSLLDGSLNGLPAKVQKNPRLQPCPTDSRSADPVGTERGCLIPPACPSLHSPQYLMPAATVSRSGNPGPRSAIGESGCLSTAWDESQMQCYHAACDKRP